MFNRFHISVLTALLAVVAANSETPASAKKVVRTDVDFTIVTRVSPKAHRKQLSMTYQGSVESSSAESGQSLAKSQGFDPRDYDYMNEQVFTTAY